MTDQHKYRLKTGKAAEQQLDNLDKLFGKESRKFLSGVGLKEGGQVADVGCGIGNLSCWLAEQIGSRGHVYAIDNSIKQLEIAKQRANQRGIKNISFHEMDVHDLSEFNEHFDLTYCRWLLVHVKDPLLAVKSMAKTVRPKGILACEAGDMRTNDCYPKFPAHTQFFEKSNELLRQTDCDVNISFKIFGIFKSLKEFSDVKIKLSQPLISARDEIKVFGQQMCVLLDSISESLIEKNIMSQNEIEKLKTEILDHPIEENTLIFLARMTQIWCRKSA